MSPREAAEQMPKLGKPQAAVMRRLRRLGVAFKDGRGWRFKGDRDRVQFKVVDDLLNRGLAFEQAGAPAMLKLTPRGSLLAASLCGETKERANV